MTRVFAWRAVRKHALRTPACMPVPLWDILGWLVAGWGRVSVCVMCVVITWWALVKVYGIVNSPAQIVATTDINQENNFES